MAQMDALALEAAEEVFGHGVVIGIALAGHALPDAEAGETLTVSVGKAYIVWDFLRQNHIMVKMSIKCGLRILQVVNY